MITAMILLALGSSSTQELRSLAEELNRLRTHTAIVLPSSAVDEYPLWSPSGDYIAVNVMGKWYKVNLSEISLQKGLWRGGQEIGVISSRTSVSDASDKEVEQWKKVSRFSPRAVTTKAGTNIELKGTDLGTTLTIRKREQKPQAVWTSETENCHSLVLSVDDRYVAFICESNGVAIMRLSDTK